MTTPTWKALRWLAPISLGMIVFVATGLFIPPSQTSSGRGLAAFTMKQFETDSPQQKNAEGDVMTYGQQQYQARAYPAATIASSSYINAEKQFNLVTNFTGSMNWHELGPTSAPNAGFPDPTTNAAQFTSGRVTAVAVVPSTCAIGGCSTIYIGTASGGLWKTIDGGTTWKNLQDGQLNDSVSGITLDPVSSNTIYVGTGENNQCIGCNHGIGILKSTDGGRSFTNLGRSYFANRSVSQVVVDATNTNTMYVAIASGSNGFSDTTGSDNAPILPTRGVWKSTDGGKTWTLSTDFGPNPGGRRTMSLVMDPMNDLVLYAGVNGLGVMKTIDGGGSWFRTGGTTQPNNINPGFGRTQIAIAPTNHNTVYAAYDTGLTGAGTGVRLYRSNDAGATWTRIPAALLPQTCQSPAGAQCWYDVPLAVGPDSADSVYLGGAANYAYMFTGGGPCAPSSATYPFFCNSSIVNTTDGGTTWHDISQDAANGPIHPDNHSIVIDPSDASTIYTGTDGGVFRSTDGGATWTNLTSHVDSFQFNNVSVGPDGVVYGGTQDNGTYRIDPRTGTGVAVHVDAGDGGDALANPTDPNVAWYAQTGSSMDKDVTTKANQNGYHWEPNTVFNI